MNKWKTVPSLTLWNFDVESDQVVHWTFIIIHYVAWAIVYGGVLMMDLPELCGVKDVSEIKRLILISIKLKQFCCVVGVL